MFDKYKASAANNRINEELLYEQVVKELQSGIKREGLWAKAFAKSGGDESKAKALYLEYRVQSLKDEIETEEYQTNNEHPPQENDNIPSPTITKMKDKNYQKIGGWLLFLCISLTILSPLYTIGNLENSAKELAPYFDTYPQLTSAFLNFKYLTFGLVAFSFYAGFSLWNKSKNAVKVAKAYFISALIYFIVSPFIFSSTPNLPQEFYNAINQQGVEDFIKSLVFFATWYTYLCRSKRVKSTYLSAISDAKSDSNKNEYSEHNSFVQHSKFNWLPILIILSISGLAFFSSSGNKKKPDKVQVINYSDESSYEGTLTLNNNTKTHVNKNTIIKYVPDEHAKNNTSIAKDDFFSPKAHWDNKNTPLFINLNTLEPNGNCLKGTNFKQVSKGVLLMTCFNKMDITKNLLLLTKNKHYIAAGKCTNNILTTRESCKFGVYKYDQGGRRYYTDEIPRNKKYSMVSGVRLPKYWSSQKYVGSPISIAECENIVTNFKKINLSETCFTYRN